MVFDRIELGCGSMVADVLVELKAKQIDQTFTYNIPPNLIEEITVGKRVLVPFSKQQLEGFVLKVYESNEFEYKLKDIIKLIDEESVLNEELLDLGKYISKKNMCNLISAYQTMLPTALKAKSNTIINKKYQTYLKLIDDNYIGKNDKQKEIINKLKSGDCIKHEVSSISLSSINSLIKNKVIEEYKLEEYRLDSSCNKIDTHVSLTLEQSKVVEEITKQLNKFIPYLLYGVTGSGKTEVYMNVIESVLKLNKSALVLVPEISLTPQLVNTFKNRFGSMIAILHSRLSDGEKYDEWRKIEKGEVSIVIGARSAIFAPLNNIGVIIVDEEHTQTYKQENNPKYNAIDIALYRAKTYSCPLILGSATPSIESYTRAKLGIYKLLTMKHRVNNNLPLVKLIDMKDSIRNGYKVISRELNEAITNCLDNDEQVILLLNRRGYSTTVSCHDCGEKIICPNCEIPLTYHKKNNTMRCHYCNYITFKPNDCPECHSSNINEFGMGTEKLDEEVKRLFKKAKTIRMDVDTTTKKGSHERIITAFKNKEYNILIGTQMISKGLDFNDVTLVGVINGDASLNIPDFRSAERTYSLLNQVAGRAGRANKKGYVVIQGFNLNHYSILCASRHDYESFYDEEMAIRKQLNYPPYCNLSLIKIISTNYDECVKESNNIYSYLSNKISRDVIILGPSNSSMPKVNNKYYMQIILKYKNVNNLYPLLQFINNKYKTNRLVNVDIDLNPIRL